MAIDLMQTLDVIEALENYIFRIRPPEETRELFDVTYKIEKQSVIIYEISPYWNNMDKFYETDIAKATFLKTKQQWKVYWKQSSSKWLIYDPMPFVKTIKEFTMLVETDKHHCFFGKKPT
jgi:hypothetical protein